MMKDAIDQSSFDVLEAHSKYRSDFFEKVGVSRTG